MSSPDTIAFYCPCGQRLAAVTSTASVACTRCGAVVPVPARAPYAASLSTEAAGSTGFGRIVLAIVLLVIGVVAFAVALWWSSALDTVAATRPDVIASDPRGVTNLHTLIVVGYVVGAAGVGGGIALLVTARKRRG